MLARTTTTVLGRRIGYLRAGAGPALVLLHGIGGNAGQWRHQLDDLSDAFDVVAWDAPGYGDSDDPPAGWTMADYAAHLAALLDILGLQRVHLLGQSWGGVLAGEFLREHAGRVLSLILADTFAGGTQPEEERRASLAARLRALDTMTPAEMARARVSALVGPDTPPATRAEIEAMLAEIHPAGYRQAAIALAEADTRDVLPRVAVPTLVLAGETDQIVPMAAAEHLRGIVPAAHLVVIPGTGHLSSQERPDLFNAALRDFLSGG